MKVYRLQTVQQLPVDLSAAWSFFSNPANLEGITPPELKFRIITRVPRDVYTGLLIGYRLRVPPGLPVTWWTEIKHVEAPHRFVDEQRFGPYALWYHEHHFRAVDGGVEMTDTVHYALPGGWLGRLAHSLFVGRQVRGIFEHRTKVLEKLAAEGGLVPATAGDTRGP
jgi:ligand-binding SRPBCC domain-containing protein